MTNVVGLDLSLTGTAYVVLDTNGNIVDKHVIRPKKKGVERLEEIQDHMLGFLAKLPFGTPFAVEGYAFGANQVAHSQGELGGVIRLLLYENKFPYIDVAPSIVKKFATGKGNAKKEQVMLHVMKRWGHHFETNDEADAFVLALIALESFHGVSPTQLTIPQKESLAKVGKVNLKQQKKGA